MTSSSVERLAVDREIADLRRVLRDVHGLDVDNPRSGPSNIDYAALAADPVRRDERPEPEPSPAEAQMMRDYDRLRRLERYQQSLRPQTSERDQTPASSGSPVVSRPRERRARRSVRRCASSSDPSDSDDDPEPALGGRMAPARARSAA